MSPSPFSPRGEDKIDQPDLMLVTCVLKLNKLKGRFRNVGGNISQVQRIPRLPDSVHLPMATGKDVAKILRSSVQGASRVQFID
jgi:hypothetical protein